MSSKIFEGVLRFGKRFVASADPFFIAEPFRRLAIIMQCFYEQRKLCVVLLPKCIQKKK